MTKNKVIVALTIVVVVCMVFIAVLLVTGKEETTVQETSESYTDTTYATYENAENDSEFYENLKSEDVSIYNIAGPTGGMIESELVMDNIDSVSFVMDNFDVIFTSLFVDGEYVLEVSSGDISVDSSTFSFTDTDMQVVFRYMSRDYELHIHKDTQVIEAVPVPLND